MVILLFGVTNVGKTVTGEILARKLNYQFFDLDEEIKKRYQTTLEQFMQDNPRHQDRYRIKGEILKELAQEPADDIVISVSPIYDAKYFNHLLEQENVMAIELQDSVEHIYQRLVFSDENDVVYRDDEYKEAHRDYYLNDIREDIRYMRPIFKKIRYKYFIDNKTPEQAASGVLAMIQEKENIVSVPTQDFAVLAKDAHVVCRDFEIFCKYIGERKVKISKKTGHIGKKDCFELNQLLYKREEYEKATHFQNDYPIIHMFYYVAIKYKILEMNESGTSLVDGRNYTVFWQSAAVEQYLLFILNLMFDARFVGRDSFRTMNIEYFWEYLSERHMKVGSIYQISGNELGTWRIGGEGMMPYLEELRLVQVVKRGSWSYRARGAVVDWEVEAMPWLEQIIKLYDTWFLEDEHLLDEDEKIAEYYSFYLKEIQPESKESTLLDLFKPVSGDFHNKIIDLEVKTRYDNCLRVIRMNLSDSLYLLHRTIQEAFDFDDDHLFEFYIGRGDFKKAYTLSEGITSEEELSSEDTSMGDLELFKGQTFSYLFDFGDMWWFDIKVLQIIEGEVEDATVIRSEGEAPRQYPSYEEYDDEDDECDIDEYEMDFEEYEVKIDEKITVAEILNSIEDELIEIEYLAITGSKQDDDLDGLTPEEQRAYIEEQRAYIEEQVLTEPDKLLTFMTKEMQEMLSILFRESYLEKSELCEIAKLYSFGFCAFSEDYEGEIKVPAKIKAIYGGKRKGMEQKNRITEVTELLLERCGVIEMEQLYQDALKFVQTKISYKEYEFMIYSRLHYFGEYYSNSFAGGEFMSCYDADVTEKILTERMKPENTGYQYPDFANMDLKDLQQKPEILKKWEEYIKFNLNIDDEATSWLIRQIPAMAATGIAEVEDIIRIYKKVVQSAGSKTSKKAEKMITDLCKGMPLATKRGNLAPDEQSNYQQMTLFDD